MSVQVNTLARVLHPHSLVSSVDFCTSSIFPIARSGRKCTVILAVPKGEYRVNTLIRVVFTSPWGFGTLLHEYDLFHSSVGTQVWSYLSVPRGEYLVSTLARVCIPIALLVRLGCENPTACFAHAIVAGRTPVPKQCSYRNIDSRPGLGHCFSLWLCRPDLVRLEVYFVSSFFLLRLCWGSEASIAIQWVCCSAFSSDCGDLARRRQGIVLLTDRYFSFLTCLYTRRAPGKIILLEQVFLIVVVLPTTRGRGLECFQFSILA